MESHILPQLCMSAPLGTRYTDFTVNSKFPANHGSYVQCFSCLKHWTKRFSADFSRSFADLQTGCKWLPTKYTEYTYQQNETFFFPEISTDFVFQNLPEEIQSKIIYFYSVINEYSLHSWDVHFVPSWHKWSGFEYRPWCLVIVVRAPPDNSLNLCKTWKTCIFKTAFHVKQYITSSFYLSFNRSWAMINHSLCSVHVYV